MDNTKQQQGVRCSSGRRPAGTKHGPWRARGAGWRARSTCNGNVVSVYCGSRRIVGVGAYWGEGGIRGYYGGDEGVDAEV